GGRPRRRRARRGPDPRRSARASVLTARDRRPIVAGRPVGVGCERVALAGVTDGGIWCGDHGNGRVAKPADAGVRRSSPKPHGPNALGGLRDAPRIVERTTVVAARNCRAAEAIGGYRHCMFQRALGGAATFAALTVAFPGWSQGPAGAPTAGEEEAPEQGDAPRGDDA